MGGWKHAAWPTGLVVGDLVRALRPLDEESVVPGTLGVVFAEADAYNDGNGPMVRFMTGHACNVYEGDVERMPWGDS